MTHYYTYSGGEISSRLTWDRGKDRTDDVPLGVNLNTNRQNKFNGKDEGHFQRNQGTHKSPTGWEAEGSDKPTPINIDVGLRTTHERSEEGTRLALEIGR